MIQNFSLCPVQFVVDLITRTARRTTLRTRAALKHRRYRCARNVTPPRPTSSTTRARGIRTTPAATISPDHPPRSRREKRGRSSCARNKPACTTNYKKKKGRNSPFNSTVRRLEESCGKRYTQRAQPQQASPVQALAGPVTTECRILRQPRLVLCCARDEPNTS